MLEGTCSGKVCVPVDVWSVRYSKTSKSKNTKLWRAGPGAWAAESQLRYRFGSHQHGNSRWIHDFGKHTFENFTSLFIFVAISFLYWSQLSFIGVIKMYNFINKKRLLSLLQNVKWFFWVPILLLDTLPFKICRSWAFHGHINYTCGLFFHVCNLNYLLSYCFECINIPTV